MMELSILLEQAHTLRTLAAASDQSIIREGLWRLAERREGLARRSGSTPQTRVLDCDDSI